MTDFVGNRTSNLHNEGQPPLPTRLQELSTLPPRSDTDGYVIPSHQVNSVATAMYMRADVEPTSANIHTTTHTPPQRIQNKETDNIFNQQDNIDRTCGHT